MKIAILITTMSGGGAERVVANLSDYLTNAGNDVYIAAIRGLKSQYELSPKVRITFLSTHQIDNSNNKVKQHLNEIRAILQFYNELKNYDCLISFLTLPLALSLLFRNRIPCPLIISERNYPGSYSFFYQAILKLFCSRADGAVFQTEAVRHWYRRYRGKYAVIANAVNEEFYYSSIVKEYPPIIVNVGRFTEQKNQKLLIMAYAKIREKHLGSRLYLYGDGPLRQELIQLISHYHLQDCAVVEQFRTDIRDHLLNAGIFVLSSNYEGMPNALLEAMALGLACVATDCDGGGAKVLIRNGENGILVEKDNISAMADALDKLLSDPDCRKQIGQEATTVREIYSYKNIYSKWVSFIQTVALEKKVP